MSKEELEFYTQGSITNINPEGKKEVKWEGNFNGNDGEFKINSDDDGEKIIKFNKDELNELLTHHSSNASLEKRLIQDFMTSVPFKNMVSSVRLTKMRRSRNRNKNKKRKTRKYKK